MFITQRQINTLARVMQSLAEPYAEEEIRIRVGQQLLDLLGAQHFASYVWQPAGGCFAGHFSSRVYLNMAPDNLLQYERYYQFHDPITPKLQRCHQATHVGTVMPQKDLVRTEFFNDFLARDGLYWGVNLFAWSEGRNIGDLRIWRDRQHDDFSSQDIQLLDMLRPAFTAAMARCRGPQQTRPSAGTDAETGHCMVPVASGGSALSAREREIAQLVSCGMSDKEIARRLGISLSTVRTHLDHAFRKLGADNRMQLVQRLGL